MPIINPDLYNLSASSAAMNIKTGYSLRQLNSFGMDVYAKYFSSFCSAPELKNLLREYPDEKTLILGGGTNLLFTTNYDGLVLKNEISGIEQISEDEEHVYLRVGAGENWHEFVLYCVDQNLGGVENLALIPGNAGASPMQNIGAYGVEIRDVFHQLEAYHIGDEEIRVFNLEDCEFGYRESVFKGKYKDQFVILNVSFRLKKIPVINTRYGAISAELENMNVETVDIRAVANAVMNIRRSKLPDPRETGNAGSFFKNPTIPLGQFLELKKANPAIIGYPAAEDKIKLAAGWLIEQCGWKGYREGDAGCHPRQALVLVNYGNASGEEILALSDKIRLSVLENFGVNLEREVNIIR